MPGAARSSPARGGSILDFVGNTPLVQIRSDRQPNCRVLAKAEFYSPSGGPKDRVVKRIVEKAEKDGLLKPGMALIEASTGSTGIATALVAAVRGYDAVIVMPEGMSRERRQLIEALGARLELTQGSGSDIERAIARVKELMAGDPGRYFFINQFANRENVETHYRETGPEIWEQTGGALDAFVAMMGTGGTVTGVSRYLKERDPRIRCFAGEPTSSATYLTGQKGAHVIEGVGDGLVPEVFDREVVDGFVLIGDEEALSMCRWLARRHGLLVGPSSGANVAAALKLAEAYPELETIVTILPDTALRYLSTGLYGRAGVGVDAQGPDGPVEWWQERCVQRLTVVR